MFLAATIGVKLLEENALLNSSVMKSNDKWRIVNDVVMGGLSSSKVLVENNKIIFTGNVSLKNNGGFASLRSPVKDYNFKNFSGIEIKIKGDGKLYSISMKETSYFTGYFYTASFETKADEWMTIKLPFDKFKLYYFGRKINSNSGVPLENIKEISFLIGDKQEGNFVAEIDYIKLY
jgi:monofunctional biosynthetic peptidoglycan transglycosylase